MVRKCVFEDIGLFDESLKRLEDWDWLLRFSQKYKMCVLNEPLARINVGASPKSSLVLSSLSTFQNKWLPKLTSAQKIELLTSIQIEKLSLYKNKGFFSLSVNIIYLIFKSPYLSFLVMRRIVGRVFF